MEVSVGSAGVNGLHEGNRTCDQRELVLLWTGEPGWQYFDGPGESGCASLQGIIGAANVAYKWQSVELRHTSLGEARLKIMGVFSDLLGSPADLVTAFGRVSWFLEVILASIELHQRSRVDLIRKVAWLDHGTPKSHASIEDFRFHELRHTWRRRNVTSVATFPLRSVN
jgi:hypothetical protein